MSVGEIQRIASLSRRDAEIANIERAMRSVVAASVTLTDSEQAVSDALLDAAKSLRRALDLRRSSDP